MCTLAKLPAAIALTGAVHAEQGILHLFQGPNPVS